MTSQYCIAGHIFVVQILLWNFLSIGVVVSDHGLHGSAGTVLTAITLSCGKWRNSTPHRIKTPSLVGTKLWTYDYVREICPQIYFCKNPCSGGLWREWWNYLKYDISIFSKSTFFSRKRLQVTPVDRCSRAVAQTRGQSNLTKSASRGPIPRLGVTPGGRKLYHWIPGVGFPISVP